jgi:hypothetical protein
MVRSPISQMSSWKDNPYSLEPCFDRSWSEMTESCFANTSPEWHDIVEGCDKNVKTDKSIEFDSSVDVYNRYLELYLQLQKDSRIGDVILIPFEDLVITPGAELTRIAEAMGWDVPEQIQIFEAEAKTHGSSKNREEALDHLDSREWLDGVEEDTLQSICALLNVTALEGFSEGTNSVEPLPYLYDCNNHSAAAGAALVAS